MITVLNVAEKPSVARSLTQVFSNSTGASNNNNRRRRNHNAAQIFTIDNVRFPSVLPTSNLPSTEVPHKMIVTSVRGHLSNREFAGNYRSWSGCSPSQLFSAPLEVCYEDDKKPLEAMLQSLARECQALILWLDCDREGEHIAHEVQQACEKGNARMRFLSAGVGVRQCVVYRAKFSTVLPQEIYNALRTLGRIDMRLVDAVEARMELDLRVGAAFTRFQTFRLQKRFDGLQGQVISYGPCQFPTLGFIVERWARIETFVPDDFWTIDMSISVPNNVDGRSSSGGRKTLRMTWKRGRLYDRILAMSFYDICREVGEATVIDMRGRPKNRWRPIPLATVDLQKRCAKFLRIGSEHFMQAAEALYNDGLISYPRTETEIFSPEFQHRPLIQALQEIGEEIGIYASKLLNENKFQNPRAGKNDDKAHPPITPCRAVDPNTISDHNQRQIYILIVKHYLACCSRDALGKETEIITQMGSEIFTAKGLMITEHNWLEIYKPWERWGTGQGLLPTVDIGSKFVPSQLMLSQGRTAPPTLLSEAELIGLMDKSGIGTDATIAQHISTIQERSYAEKDQSQKFHPTKLGISLVEGYNSMGYQLNRPDLRREVEQECNLVASGQKRKEEILGPILEKMKEIFDRANSEADKLDAAVARYFPRLGTNLENSTVIRNNVSQCGCGQLMSLKVSNSSSQNGHNRRSNTQVQEKFLYCSSCSLGLRLPRGSPDAAFHEGSRSKILCKICNFQAIRISRGNGYDGNGYSICPKCFTDAPIEHGGNGSGDFRCFSCTNTDCSLAGGTKGGDVEILPCPFCASQNKAARVVLKKVARRYLLSCENNSVGTGGCSYTIWLPRESSDVEVSNGSSCSSCPIGPKLLKFSWKSGSLPPHYGRFHTCCILCDDFLKHELNVRIPIHNQVRIYNNRSTTRGRGRTSGQRR